MSCGDEMGGLLSRYVDNELPPPERARVEGHLADCTACKELLSIFLRNESMLSNALAHEAFGETVVDRVMERIEGATPSAEPVEETRWESFTGWLRERSWMRMAAAAGVLVALFGVLLFANTKRDAAFRREVADLQSDLRDQEKSLRDLHRVTHDQTTVLLQSNESLLREARRWREIAFLLSAPKGTIMGGLIENRTLVVRTRFENPDQYVAYLIYRSDEKPENFKLLASGLKDSHYEDGTAKPGKLYWYKFEALELNGKAHPSVPVPLRMPVPGGLDPEKCLKILCLTIGPEDNVATFVVSRIVNQVEVEYFFTVRLGQAIGRVVEGVDYTTGLIFDKVERGDETLKVTFAWPKVDDAGEPLHDDFKQPSFQYEDKVLNVRENKRAVLKSGNFELKIWKDSSALVEPKK